MPAKGKYFLNDQEPDRGSLYRQYCCISKHQLLVLLLGIAVVSCLGLLIVFFASGLIAAEHALFLSTVCSALALFLLVFILVCTESLFQRWMRFLGVAVWICLLTMGFVFIFDGKVIRAWDQVRAHSLWLHYYGTRYGLIHYGCTIMGPAFHKKMMESALEQTFLDTLSCLEIRMKLEIEKRQQETLLLSVLPAYISMEMKLAIIERLKESKDRDAQQRQVKDNNFHSLYVKRHRNVRSTG
ncbi:UNVERIFIED_CONTAM: hypothetical protein FKN15_061289 [Acipenser sinensis]